MEATVDVSEEVVSDHSIPNEWTLFVEYIRRMAQPAVVEASHIESVWRITRKATGSS